MKPRIQDPKPAKKSRGGAKTPARVRPFEQWRGGLETWDSEVAKLKAEFESENPKIPVRDEWAWHDENGKIRIEESKSPPAGAVKVFKHFSGYSWGLNATLGLQLALLFRVTQHESVVPKDTKVRVLSRLEEARKMFPNQTIKEADSVETASHMRDYIAAAAAQNVMYLTEDFGDAVNGRITMPEDEFWRLIYHAIQFGAHDELAKIFKDTEAINASVVGQRMNRRGKGAPHRKKRDQKGNPFRELVADFVSDGKSLGRDASGIWPYVLTELRKAGCKSIGSGKGERLEWRDRDAGAFDFKIDTIQRWVRAEFNNPTG